MSTPAPSRIASLLLACAVLVSCGGGGGAGGQTPTTPSCQNYNAIVSSPSLWTQLTPTGTAPPGRGGHVPVYDAANDRLIIFGGKNSSQYFNDTWVLANASAVSATPSWSQLTTSTVPSAPQRYGAIGAYNAPKNMLIVFGGVNENNSIQMELWTLTNANGLQGPTPTWSKLTVSGTAPSARVSMPGVYDETNDTLIFFGGLGCSSTACTQYNETWTIRDATTAPAWQKLAPAGTVPTARSYHSAVYDPANNRMIMFGGNTSTSNPLASSGRVDDTWILSNANGVGGTPAWSQLNVMDKPAARSSHSAVFDGTNNRMIIFAGAGTDNIVRKDVWILVDAGGTSPRWAEYDTGMPKPNSRASHSAVYTGTSKNRMIIFGGDTGGGTYVSDAWVLRNANGIPTTPIGSITIKSASATVCSGYTTQLTAVATDSSGNEISGVLYFWSTSDPNVATVSSNGMVTAVGAGTAVITASSGTASGQFTVVVSQPAPSPGGGVTGTWKGTFQVTDEDYTYGVWTCTYVTTGSITFTLSQSGSNVSGESVIANLHDTVIWHDPILSCPPPVPHTFPNGDIVGTVNSGGNLNITYFTLDGGVYPPFTATISGNTMTGNFNNASGFGPIDSLRTGSFTVTKQ